MMIRKAALLAAIALTTTSACATGEEVCRDNGTVIRCRDANTGQPIERCHRNWRGTLVCRAAQ